MVGCGVCAGCDGKSGSPEGGAGAAGQPGQPDSASVVLGTGEAEFEPMDGEPTLEMAAGFQGGFHVWASLQAQGFSEERLDMVLVSELDGDPDSALTMRATLRGTFDQNERGDPVWTFAGYPAQIRDARCAHGKRAHLSVSLSEPSGKEASDERHCFVSLEEDYRSNDCD